MRRGVGDARKAQPEQSSLNRARVVAIAGETAKHFSPVAGRDETGLEERTHALRFSFPEQKHPVN